MFNNIFKSSFVAREKKKEKERKKSEESEEKLKKAQGNDFTRGNIYAIEKAGMVERNDLYLY